MNEDQSSVEGAPAPYQGRYGHPVYDQIGDYFKQATGVDATQQQVSQWGTNIDPTYMGKIRSAIDATPDAQAYRTQQAQKAAPAAAAPTPAPTPTPTASGSPVSATGQIPPQAAGLQPAPAPATRGQEPDQTRYVQPVDLSSVPGYQKTNFNVALPDAYRAGTVPQSAFYQGNTFDQFAGPDQGANDAQQSALMKAILANPDTMNPQVIAQLQEQQKEQALLMQRQGQQDADSNAAATGRLGSGYASAAADSRKQAAIDAILKGNRDISIQAASTNRGDELNALNASEALAQGQLGRATSGYNTRLGGQQAQSASDIAKAQSALQGTVAGEGFKQAGAQSGLARAGLDLGVQQAQADENRYANSDALNRILQQFGVNQGVASNAQQNYTADISNQLGQNSQLLDMLKYFEGQRQFDDTLGYNYNSLDQNGQNALLQAIFGSR